MKLPINICSYSNVRSLKVKNISFHNCCKWQNHSSASTVISTELFLIFIQIYISYFLHYMPLYSKLPANIKNYLETPFAFKHFCSNKSLSWCSPHPLHPLNYRRGRGLLGSQKLLLGWGWSFFHFKGKGGSIWWDLPKQVVKERGESTLRT